MTAEGGLFKLGDHFFLYFEGIIGVGGGGGAGQ
jgi:hypothetical protein